MPEADVLKMVLGPLGAVVIMFVGVVVLWRRNITLQDKRDEDRDILVGLVKEMTTKTVEDTAAINRLTEALKGRPHS